MMTVGKKRKSSLECITFEDLVLGTNAKLNETNKINEILIKIRKIEIT